MTELEICRKCGKKNYEISKLIGWGKKQGQVYHYIYTCIDCGSKYHVPRNVLFFNKVKEKDWKYSKSYTQNFAQTTLLKEES